MSQLNIKRSRGRSREEELVFTAPDGKKIYTTIGYPKGKPKGMVLFVHGLASTSVWPTMLLGSWSLRRKGYAYCRINLYDWREGARSLRTSDLRQHARDVDTVAKQLRRRGFKSLFAIGHSFGGLTLLLTDTSAFKAVSLWDPSSFIQYPPRFWLRTDKATGARYSGGSYELLMSNRFIRGMERFPNELKLISKMRAPCQICFAEGKDAMLIESSKRYFAHLNVTGELVGIPNASHSFTEEGIGEVLFRRTARWLDRWSIR